MKHLSHPVRYFLVALLSIGLAVIEIWFGHVEHHSMSLLADGLHYAAHGLVAIVSLFLSITNTMRPHRIRSVSLFLLVFLIAGSIGSIITLLATGYESGHLLSAPGKVALLAIVSVFVGLIQIRLIGHDHNGDKSGGLSHDDICFGLTWHMYADVLKSILLIFLACLSLIVTIPSYQDMDARIALGIAILYGVSLVPLLLRVLSKLARRD